MKFKRSICVAAASLIVFTAAGCASAGAASSYDDICGATEEVAESGLTEGEGGTESGTESVVQAEPEETESAADGQKSADGQAETVEEETETAAETEAETETETVAEEDGEDDGETAAQAVTYVKVTADGVNMRSGAGTGYSVLGSAEEGTLYSCEGEYGGWYRIGYLNGYAYISSKYAVLTEMAANDNGLVESVIAVGAQLLGTPYVYGAVRYHDGNGNKLSGFTVTQFDCSSLMQYIFYMGAGVLLDVTTRTQVLQGTAVSRSELQRGEFIFFTNSSRYNNTGIERVGHVALYLGDNYILHTASDYAKIEQISSARWSYYIQARRMI